MTLRDIINIDPEIMHGTPVFRGTRVPIQHLFDHLEGNVTIEEFLEGFPSVSREQVMGLLDIISRNITTERYLNFHEAAA